MLNEPPPLPPGPHLFLVRSPPTPSPNFAHPTHSITAASTTVTTHRYSNLYRIHHRRRCSLRYRFLPSLPSFPSSPPFYILFLPVTCSSSFTSLRIQFYFKFSYTDFLAAEQSQKNTKYCSWNRSPTARSQRTTNV